MGFDTPLYSTVVMRAIWDNKKGSLGERELSAKRIEALSHSQGENPSVKSCAFATSPVRGGKRVCGKLSWLPE